MSSSTTTHAPAMPQSEEIATVARAIVGHQVQRTLAAAAGVDQATIHNALRGKRLRMEIVLRIADQLALAPPLRAEWFAAHGYPDPRAPLTYEAVPPGIVEAWHGARDLPPGDQEELTVEMQALITAKRRKRGLE